MKYLGKAFGEHLGEVLINALAKSFVNTLANCFTKFEINSSVEFLANSLETSWHVFGELLVAMSLVDSLVNSLAMSLVPISLRRTFEASLVFS